MDPISCFACLLVLSCIPVAVAWLYSKSVTSARTDFAVWARGVSFANYSDLGNADRQTLAWEYAGPNTHVLRDSSQSFAKLRLTYFGDIVGAESAEGALIVEGPQRLFNSQLILRNAGTEAISARINIPHAKGVIELPSGRKYRGEAKRKGLFSSLFAWQLLDESNVPILSVGAGEDAVTIEPNDLAKPDLLTLVILGKYLVVWATKEFSGD